MSQPCRANIVLSLSVGVYRVALVVPSWLKKPSFTNRFAFSHTTKRDTPPALRRSALVAQPCAVNCIVSGRLQYSGICEKGQKSVGPWGVVSRNGCATEGRLFMRSARDTYH